MTVLEQVMTRSSALMVEAFEREPVWQDGVLAALEALLVFLDAEPVSARICLVESLAGPPAALRLRQAPPRPSQERVSIPKEVRHARADRLRLCLAYIAENPGVSNQAIASGIDLSHLGQTSTALSRLNRVGLLRKQAGGAGLPNGWWLTAHGERSCAHSNIPEPISSEEFRTTTSTIVSVMVVPRGRLLQTQLFWTHALGELLM